MGQVEERARQFDSVFTTEELKAGLGSRKAVPVSHMDSAAGRSDTASLGAAGSFAASAESFRERLRRARSVSRSTVSAAASEPPAASTTGRSPAAAARGAAAPSMPRAASRSKAEPAGPPSPPPAPSFPPPPPRPAPAAESPVALAPGEALIAHCPPSAIHSVSTILSTMPAVFSGASFALNHAGYGLPMPWWGIAMGGAASAVAIGVQWYITGRHVHSLVALPDGCHVRVTTSSPLGMLPKASAVVPVAFFGHRHNEAAGTVYVTIAAPGTAPDSVRPVFLPLEERTTVPDRDVLDALLAGRAPLGCASSPVDPAVAYWKQATSESGRPYWFNEATRQRQWDAPAHVKEHMAAQQQE